MDPLHFRMNRTHIQIVQYYPGKIVSYSNITRVKLTAGYFPGTSRWSAHRLLHGWDGRGLMLRGEEVKREEGGR
jgi:hypothetical protein